MRRAIQATYKSGSNALAEARETRTAAKFHQFRIEAKTLWYQLRILRPINPVVLNSLADDQVVNVVETQDHARVIKTFDLLLE